MLKSGTSYLDLAGEVPQHLAAWPWKSPPKVGVTLIPGVGFGVAPTDCAGLLAARALPDTDALTIAYETREPSRGTLQTVLPMLHTLGWRRVGGKLSATRPGRVSRVFQDGSRSVRVVTNPWRADLVSAGFRGRGRRRHLLELPNGSAPADANWRDGDSPADGGTGPEVRAERTKRGRPDRSATIWAEARRTRAQAPNVALRPDRTHRSLRCAVRELAFEVGLRRQGFRRLAPRLALISSGP